jgi:hypothetical protein
MRTKRRVVVRCMACAIGGGLILVALLLWWAGVPEPVAWDSTTPVSESIPDDGRVWTISEYGVTITFHPHSVDGSSVFTFTPKSGFSPEPPVIGLYSFELLGTYDEDGRPVTLYDDPWLDDDHIDIVLQYDESELDGVEESSLLFYHILGVFGDRPTPQPGSVDEEADLVSCKTFEVGTFGVGGYGPRIFVPLVLLEE